MDIPAEIQFCDYYILCSDANGQTVGLRGVYRKRICVLYRGNLIVTLVYARLFSKSTINNETMRITAIF